DVQSGGGIDLGTYEAADNEVSRDSDHQCTETTSDGACVFHVLHGLVASELHMPGFFNHVDLANGADLVEYVLAAHPVPLHNVKDFFGHQDAGVRDFGTRRDLQQFGEIEDQPIGSVMTPAEQLRPASKHDRMPAFVGDLGERELHLRR